MRPLGRIVSWMMTGFLAATWAPLAGAQTPTLPEPYRIEGGKYSPQEKRDAAQRPDGLVLTASVVGKQERKLSSLAPAPISVRKELMRFEAGRLGEFVSDYNDFTQYFEEVL